MTSFSDRKHALQKAKRQALSLLLLAVLVFAVTQFLGDDFWVRCVRAMSEAAMIGALADWFAVSALFRRIPLPVVGRHTDIIARNKDRIGENLGQFVRERFMGAESLESMLDRYDVVERIALWMSAPEHAKTLGVQVVRLVSGALDFVEDKRIEAFVRMALRRLLGQMDFSQGLGSALQMLTAQGRHQILLEEGMERLIEVLQQPQTRTLIAHSISRWLRVEHPRTEKILPTDWISDKGGALVANALESLLEEISKQPQHVLRQRFDDILVKWIDNLNTDPVWIQQGEQFRRYVQTNPDLGRYASSLWKDVRRALQRDLHRKDSRLAQQVARLGVWLGQSVAGDDALRESLRVHLHQWMRTVAPDISRYFSDHIRDTVQRWDAEDLARLVEDNIGRDLQYIRINGTLVGGLIGLLLFLLSETARQWR